MVIIASYKRKLHDVTILCYKLQVVTQIALLHCFGASYALFWCDPPLANRFCTLLLPVVESAIGLGAALVEAKPQVRSALREQQGVPSRTRRLVRQPLTVVAESVQSLP